MNRGSLVLEQSHPQIASCISFHLDRQSLVSNQTEPNVDDHFWGGGAPVMFSFSLATNNAGGVRVGQEICVPVMIIRTLDSGTMLDCSCRPFILSIV